MSAKGEAMTLSYHFLAEVVLGFQTIESTRLLMTEFGCAAVEVAAN
jgi:hypothetical protein